VFAKLKEVNQEAEKLAAMLSKKLPTSVLNNPTRKLSPGRITSILEEVFAEAVQFGTDHKLGFIARAKLGNDFRWKLKEMGYAPAFIDVATEGLLVYVSRPSKKVAAPTT
jgi:hypothetical protein